MPIEVNYFAVLVAAVAAMLLGGLWYSPLLFGNKWQRLMEKSGTDIGKLKQKGGMGKSYFLMFVGALITAFVLAHFVNIFGVVDVEGACDLAFWIWLGFVATYSLGSVLWEGKSWMLYVINIAYQFVALFVMAVILGVWMV